MTRTPPPTPTLLLTGFEPFGGRPRNRSWAVVRAMEGEVLAGHIIRTRELPVHFERLSEVVPALLAGRPEAGSSRGDPPSASPPDLDPPRGILLTGEAPGARLRVEAVALNLGWAPMGDEAGGRPEGGELREGAPLGLWGSWNAVAVAEALRGGGLPAIPSFHAGSYACNAAYFFALAAAGEASRLGHPPPAIGFLHLPRRGSSLRALRDAVRRALSILSEATGR